MSKNNEQNNSGTTPESDIVIVNDAKPTDPKVKYAVSAAQSVLNAVQRHGLGNLGLLALSTEKVPVNFQFLFGGLSSRVVNNLAGIMPTLMLRQEMDERGFPRWQIVAAATASETAIGTPLEVHGSKPALAKIGTNITNQDLAKISARVSPALYARNMFVWLIASIGNGEMTLTEKAALGGATGTLSIVPHNFANLLMMQGTKTNKEAFSNVYEKVKADPKLLIKGTWLRAAAGVFGSIALSQNTSQFLQEKMQALLDLMPQIDISKPITSIKDSSKPDSDFDNLSERERLETAQSIITIYRDAAKEISQKQAEDNLQPVSELPPPTTTAIASASKVVTPEKSRTN